MKEGGRAGGREGEGEGGRGARERGREGGREVEGRRGEKRRRGGRRGNESTRVHTHLDKLAVLVDTTNQCGTAAGVECLEHGTKSIESEDLENILQHGRTGVAHRVS